jgi:hypothetical protein
LVRSLQPARTVGSDEVEGDPSTGGYAETTKIFLSLYKVQASIYLLDFQKMEGNPFDFMTLCARIITELKALSQVRFTIVQIIDVKSLMPLGRRVANISSHNNSWYSNRLSKVLKAKRGLIRIPCMEQVEVMYHEAIKQLLLPPTPTKQQQHLER